MLNRGMWPPRSRGWSWTVAALGLVLFPGMGCAERATPEFRGEQAAEREAIVVSVRNQNYADVTVHVTRDGAWRRLGQVTGNSTAQLQIPESMASAGFQFRFRVHAIGSPDAADFVTERIGADRGDVIELTVAPVLRMSNWSIR